MGQGTPSAEKTTAGTVNKLLGGVQAIAVWADKNGMVPDEAMWSDPFATDALGRRRGSPWRRTVRP